jgi:hypothetical protein
MQSGNLTSRAPVAPGAPRSCRCDPACVGPGIGRSTFAALVIAYLAGVALPAAPASAASWSPQQKVLSNKRVGAPLMGIAADGTAVALWAVVPPPKITFSAPVDGLSSGGRFSKYAVQYAVRPAGATAFGAPISIQRGLPRRLGFGMAEDGRGFVERVDKEGVLSINRFDADGTLGPGEVLARRVRDAKIDVAEDGTAIVLYRRSDDGIYARTAPGGDEFGPEERLAAADADVSSIALDAGPAGRGAVAWESRSGAVFSSQQSSGGRFGPVRKVPNGANPNNSIEVAASASESFVLINGLGDLARVRVAVAPDGGHFAPAEQLPTSHGATGEFGLIDVDASGTATAVWDRFSPRNGAPDGLEIATRTAGGSFSTPRPLYRGPSAGLESLDVAADGSALVTFDGIHRRDAYIAAALRPAGEGFSSPEQVGTTTSRFSVIFSRGAIASGGQAVVGWGEPSRNLDSRGVLTSLADAEG